ncbi:HAD family hydrolase [Saccharothrix isguenensis]
MTGRVVALDAMGVLYRHADDVADLLAPYVRERGCALSDEEIEAAYRLCSSGEFDSAELWRRLGVPATASDTEYCGLHELSDGVPELLDELVAAGFRVACLSNDVSEWSLLLRRRFGLDRWIDTWVISGDIGVRKPDRRAYEHLLAAVGVPAVAVLFADDRPRNVAAAVDLGIRGVGVGQPADHAGPVVTGMSELGAVVRRWS